MKTIHDLIEFCKQNNFLQAKQELQKIESDPVYANEVGYCLVETDYLADVVSCFDWHSTTTPSHYWYEIYERLCIIEEEKFN